MNTKDKIVLGAVQHFVEQSVAETTTREIAVRAGVAEGSIYRYFPSKDELAWQIFCDYHRRLANNLSESVADKVTLLDRVNSLVACFLKMADEDWLMFRYYLTAQHMYMHKIDHESATPYQVIISVISQANDQEVQIENKELTAAMAMGVVHQIALNKLYGRIKGDLYIHLNTVAQTVYQIVTRTNRS